MKNPALSFIVPVYQKSPEVFSQCLRSLYDQSLTDIEVICVFDGENAELQEVVKAFQKVQVLVIPHGGAPKARNAGLDVAKGEYVCFFDADCQIKPDAAKRWLEEFHATDADFVYTDYDLTEGLPGFQSESFNRFSLECGNYICTMSPVKREKAPRWDETLEAAQDWDYWLTATENGLKGVYIEGASFITEVARSGDISPKGLAGPDRDALIKKIRAKHGVPERSVGVFTTSYRAMGIKMAQILDADLIKMTGHTPTIYKTIFNFGYGFMSRFDGIADDVTKIQYWLPGEIEMLQTRSYAVVTETIRIAKGVVNLVNTQYEKNKLANYGIEAEVVPLPLSKEDYEKVSKELPKDFTVLVATDDAYAKLLKDIAIDLPHIKFHYNAAKIEDFSCLLSFYQFAALDNAMLVALVNGRNVISNVQSPYTGFVDPDQTWEIFKKELYQKIREVKGAAFNADAQNYYLQLANPEDFRQKINSFSKIPLGVA